MVDQINQRSTNALCARCGSRSHTTAQCTARPAQGRAPAHNNNNQRNQRNNNNRKAPSQPCFHCGGNHWSNSCRKRQAPQAKQVGPGFSRPTRPCSHCDGNHWDQQCRKAQAGTGRNVSPQPDSRGPSGGKPTCSYCKMEGHTESVCYNKRRDENRCLNCGASDHYISSCPLPDTRSRSRGGSNNGSKGGYNPRCQLCGKFGHIAKACHSLNETKWQTESLKATTSKK